MGSWRSANEGQGGFVGEVGVGFVDQQQAGEGAGDLFEAGDGVEVAGGGDWGLTISRIAALVCSMLLGEAPRQAFRHRQDDTGSPVCGRPGFR